MRASSHDERPSCEQRGRRRRRTSRGGTGSRSAGRSPQPRRSGRHRARPRSPAAPGCGRWSQRPRAHAVGVHEVEPLPLEPVEQRLPPGALDGVPAHVGYDGGLQPLDDARATRRRPGVSTPCSTPCSKSTCMPTQMPRTGRPPASRRPMTSWPRTARQPLTQAANAPTPGTTRPSASMRGGPVGGERDLGPGPLEGAHGRAEVPRTVVEDAPDGGWRSRRQSDPWWRARPSRAGRSRPRRAAPGRRP